MSVRGPRKPVPQHAPKPPRRRKRDEQPIPATNAALNWRVNELVVGVPRADRARKVDGNV